MVRDVRRRVTKFRFLEGRKGGEGGGDHEHPLPEVEGLNLYKVL
jgi:hypothetical protein